MDETTGSVLGRLLVLVKSREVDGTILSEGMKDMASSTTTHALTSEEFARRGDAIYDRDIKPLVEPQHKGKFIAIDIYTGNYEMDSEAVMAVLRLHERLPDAQSWLVRVGQPYAHRMGGAQITR